MSSRQDEIALRSRFEDLLGPDGTATLWSMLKDRDELATTADLQSLAEGLRGEMSSLRHELRGEMSSLRDELKGEMSTLRSDVKGEMSSLRDELKGEMSGIRSELNSFIRTFIRVQAATVIGVGVMVVGLMQFL